VPLLAINSGDDPIVRELPEDAGANDWVALVTTSGGGHLGWFEGKGLLGVERWVTRPVLVSAAPRALGLG
jgi:predicted alpha/beta-fold hydrolase